jgi:hypothetical protein
VGRALTGHHAEMLDKAEDLVVCNALLGPLRAVLD